MNKSFRRFCVCLVSLSAIVIYLVTPAFAASDGFMNANLGPVPRGLPRPDIINFPKRFEPGSIVIVTKHRRLYHVTRRGKAKRYVVGVGRAGFGWKGTAVIGRKAEWPDWRPPVEMKARARTESNVILPDVMPGGRNNPLGARALYLYQNGKDTLYRIHGTNQPFQLGKANTSGCIRMLNHHVAELYEKVGNGTTVYVY